MAKYKDVEPLINALRRLLDKGELIIGVGEIMYTIKDLPAADVVKVVRCKDCKYWHSDALCCSREIHYIVNAEVNDYCSYGERKNG